MAEMKGMLFTLSAMLLGAILLTFATMLSQQSSQSGAAANWLTEVDSASDQYANIEGNVLKILSAGTNISVNNSSTVVISAHLPPEESISTDLDRYALFESNYSGMNVSMNLANVKNNSFLMQPGNTAMHGNASIFSITPQSQLLGGGNITAYALDISLMASSFDAAAWQQAVDATGNETALNVSVRVHDANYATDFEFSRLLDKGGISIINITQSGALAGYVEFSQYGALEISHPANIDLKASVSFSNPAYVEANDSISVLSAVNRTGKIRIA